MRGKEWGAGYARRCAGGERGAGRLPASASLLSTSLHWHTHQLPSFLPGPASCLALGSCSARPYSCPAGLGCASLPFLPRHSTLPPLPLPTLNLTTAPSHNPRPYLCSLSLDPRPYLPSLLALDPTAPPSLDPRSYPRSLSRPSTLRLLPLPLLTLDTTCALPLDPRPYLRSLCRRSNITPLPLSRPSTLPLLSSSTLDTTSPPSPYPRPYCPSFSRPLTLPPLPLPTL
eukprot:2049992-Rhodomonas_salina.2